MTKLEEFKQNIKGKNVTVIGIGMTVDGLVVDTEIYKDWETKYPNLMLVTQEDVKNRHKYLLLGTLPEYDIDSKRVVVGVRSNNTIFDNFELRDWIKYCKKQGACCILMHNKIKKEHDYYL